MFDLSAYTKPTHPVPSRHPSVTPMTPAQAKSTAAALLQSGLSNALANMLDFLATCDVCISTHLNVAGRTARKYLKQRILDRFPYTTPDLQEIFDTYGLPYPPEERLAIYTLGPVGIHLAKMRLGYQPSALFLALPLEQVMRRLALNEVILRLANKAVESGWVSYWVGSQRAALQKDGKPFFVPDAMLRLRKETQERVYLLAYQDTERPQHAVNIIRTHEAAAYSRLWYEQWEVDTFPPVVLIYRKSIVGRWYADSLQNTSGTQVAFYGRSLENALKPVPDWYNFHTKAKENIFPW